MTDTYRRIAEQDRAVFNTQATIMFMSTVGLIPLAVAGLYDRGTRIITGNCHIHQKRK